MSDPSDSFFSGPIVQQIYGDLDLNMKDLGCLMLDVEPPSDKRLLPNDFLYTSPNPDRPWINGWMGDKSHLTLKYGLLRPADEWRSYIDSVLIGCTIPDKVLLRGLDIFPSPYTDEPYACLVTHVDISDDLQKIYDRLSLLPHIDTYNVYRPHITLAYVKEEYGNQCGLMLRGWFDGQKNYLKTIGLNYGEEY